MPFLYSVLLLFDWSVYCLLCYCNFGLLSSLFISLCAWAYKPNRIICTWWSLNSSIIIFFTRRCHNSVSKHVNMPCHRVIHLLYSFYNNSYECIKPLDICTYTCMYILVRCRHNAWMNNMHCIDWMHTYIFYLNAFIKQEYVYVCVHAYLLYGRVYLCIMYKDITGLCKDRGQCVWFIANNGKATKKVLWVKQVLSANTDHFAQVS